MFGLHVTGKGLLKTGNFLAHDKVCAIQHPLDRGVNIGLNCLILCLKVY
jgi:hypothetical protein